MYFDNLIPKRIKILQHEAGDCIIMKSNIFGIGKCYLFYKYNIPMWSEYLANAQSFPPIEAKEQFNQLSKKPYKVIKSKWIWL